MNPKLIILVITIVLNLNHVLAFNIKQITNINGLTSNAVLSLQQDKYGFIWMGTCNGISIYDGKQVYDWNGWRKKNFNFSGYVIEEILETKEGTIWIQSNYGLSKIEKNVHNKDYPQFKGSYIMVKNQQDDLFILASDNSIHAFDKKSQSFYKLSINKPNREDIVNLYVNEHFFIIFLRNEILYYQLEKDHSGKYKLSSETTREKTYINYGFGENNTIYWIDKDYNFYEYSLDKPVKNLICNLSKTIGNKGPISDIIRVGDSFFIAFKDNGVIKISFHGYEKITVENLYIKSGVFKLLKDRFQNIVWIATDGQGVYMYSQDEYSIIQTTYNDMNINIRTPIRAIFWDNEKTLWLGTKGSGIIKIKNYNPNIQNPIPNIDILNNENKELNNNSIYAFAESKHPIFWIGHDKGVSYYSYYEKKIKPVSTSENINYIHSIYEESDSVLWLASVGTGIIRAKVSWNHERPHIDNLKRYTIDNGNFSSNFFFTLFADKNKILFGNRGYGLFTIEEDTLSSIKLKNKYEIKTVNDIYSIYHNNGEIWLGTGAGLIHKKDNIETLYNQDCGFINSIIHALIHDDKNIWISTNKGIIRFNTVNKEIRNYGIPSGLKIIEYSDGAAFKTSNTMFFGGINGFISITKNKNFIKTTKKYTPHINFMDIRIYDNNSSIIDIRGYSENSFISLKDYQNNFTISYIALDYINTDNYTYQYRINNGNWIDNGFNNTISFSQMRYGMHKIDVRYKDQSNRELSSISSLYINIKAPWYLSTLAIIFYSLFAVAIIVFIIWRFILKQKRKRQLELYRIEQNHKEELYEEKLRFFTNITHEFCTPLSLIYGPCERLLKNDNSEFVHKYVTMIKNNAERLNALIQEIIDFRRLETGHQETYISEINISEVCNSIINSFSEIAEQNHINVENKIDKNIIWNTDKNCLIKILNNLISNAFKYTYTDGVIKITVETKNNHLYISVYNSGKGIKQEDIPFIFDRYKILDNVETSKISNFTTRNGLGLAVCNSMIKLLNGNIDIKSKYGEYAEFIVILPELELSKDENKHSEFIKPNKISIELDNNKSTFDKQSIICQSIMIVDDNNEILNLLKDSLSEYYNIVTATNAKEALLMIKDNVPLLIITDVMMPGMNGFELTKQIKQNKHTMSIPVVILSAKNSNQEKILGLNSGADAYISKPFDLNYLTAIVNSLIDNRNKIKDYFNTSACAYNFANGHLVKSEDKEFIIKITEYIESNIDSEELSVEELAEHMQISVRSLYRKFKDMDMASPKDYIKEYRINMAAKLLRTTSLTIQEIIYKTGFVNRSHFYREFSKHFQMTPKSYRESLNKKSEI